MAWNEPGPGRDPWSNGPKDGGHGPGGPDLAKLLKKLRSRFSSGGGKGRGPSGSLIGLIVAAIVVLWLFSGFYTVDAQQRGVVLRFGAVAGLAQPGLGWHAPWPIGAVKTVNVTKLRQASTQNTMMTKDHNLVDISLTVQFRVSSVRAYLFNVSDPDSTLTQAAKSALRSVVSGYGVDAVLGNAQQEIAAKTKRLLEQTLDNYKCGLQVTDVALSAVQPPKQVQAAFADAIKADSDAAKTRASANAYAQDRLPRAKSQAANEIAQAHAYNDKVIAAARGEKARFDAVLGEYRKAPTATRERLYADTMRDIVRGNRVVVVGSGKAATTVNLSLPAAPLLAAPTSVAAPPAASTTSTNQSDKSDASRSRGRRGGSR